MNYGVQGMTKVIPELFVMLKSTKVEIKKSIKCWWFTRPLVSRKRAKGRRKGTLRRTSNKLLLRRRNPSLDLKPETECFYCKGTGHWKRNYPNYLVDKKDGKVNKGILDIHVIDVYLTNARSSTWVFDTGSVAMISKLETGVTKWTKTSWGKGDDVCWKWFQGW